MSVPPVLFFRADPATRAAVASAAASAGSTISGWLREAARMRLPDRGTTLPELPPSLPRRRARVPDDDVATIARLTGSVGQLTGATIQLARSLRETGCAPEHETTETILRDLRATQADLVSVVDRLRAAEATE